MAINPALITDTLKKLRVEAKLSGRMLFIACPDHKQGKENTPSMLVNIDIGRSHNIGSGHCFACGAHYFTWKDLYARLTGGDPSSAPDSSNVIVDFITGTSKLLLGEEKVDAEDFIHGMPWENEDWRGIKAFILRRLGARYVLHPEYNYLRVYLPASVNNYLVGGVRTNIEKRGKRNYFNTDGDWTHTTLFGFDLCHKLLKKRKYNCAVLVEGPRDALRYLQYGIPALAILGTGHAGKESKYHLLSSLDVDNIILAYDGDEPGEDASKKAYNILKHEYNVFKFKMKDGEDPGNQPLNRIRKLRGIIESRAA